jgi:hypothetical protein
MSLDESSERSNTCETPSSAHKAGGRAIESVHRLACGIRQLGPCQPLERHVDIPVGSTGREHRGSPLKVWGRREENRSQRCPTASPTTAAGSIAPTASWRWFGGSTLTARAPRRAGPPTRCYSIRPRLSLALRLARALLPSCIDASLRQSDTTLFELGDLRI